MGCGSSSGASEPGASADGEEQGFNYDNRGRGGKPCKDKPEEDGFPIDDAGEGEQRLAVLPCKGAIFEPANHPEPNSSAPDENFELEHVYGYRCENSRQNVYVHGPSGHVCYPAACLGVCMDPNSRTQKFFGGGKTTLQRKQQASDMDGHNDDITSFTMSQDMSICASGQSGKSPAMFVWCPATQEKKQRFKLKPGARAVSAIALSQDNTMVGCVDAHNDHVVRFYDISSGQCEYEEKGDQSNNIFDMAFSMKPGDYRACTVGVKHCYFWDPKNRKKEKQLLNGNPASSWACVAFDINGICYAGSKDGTVYVHEDGDRKCKSTFSAHKGLVGAIRWLDGKLYTGGRDGDVKIWDSTSLSCTGTVSIGHLIRAIDVCGDTLTIGDFDGTITQCSTSGGDKKIVMESHAQGEIWGLGIYGNQVVTSADDNKVKVWDYTQRCCTQTGIVSTAKKSLKNGASSMSKLPHSQQARAIDINASGQVVVGHNDGVWTARQCDKIGECVHTCDNGPSRWIEVVRFSPDGSKVAIGGHDSAIYIYNCGDWSLVCKCTAHNAAINAIDWTCDGSLIRSTCIANELLWFDANTGEQNKNPSGLTDKDYATETAKWGWIVEGIFPKGAQESDHINGVALSHDKKLIATGDDWGLVNIFRNPARKGHAPHSLRGHSEHVVRVAFNADDSYLFSVGGQDKCLMQWKKC